MSQDGKQDDLMTFEELRSVRKKAKNSDKLQALGSDFFERVSNYLQRKEQLDKKLAKVESKNAKKLFEDLLDARESKLIKLATIAAKSDIRINNLHQEEEKLFENMRESVKQHRQHLDSIVYGSEDQKQSSSEGESKKEEESGAQQTAKQTQESEEAEAVEAKNKEPAAQGTTEKEEEEKTTTTQTEAEQTKQTASEAKEREKDGQGQQQEQTEQVKQEQREAADDNTSEGNGEPETDDEQSPDVTYKKVKITADIPQFLGTDLKVYGPYHPGDVPQLPAKSARVLDKRDRAEIIETEN